MTAYQVEMRDDGGSAHEEAIEAETLEQAIQGAEEAVENWARDGEWGPEGALVWTGWELYDSAGDEVASGHLEVTIEPDHRELMRQAGADPDCAHDWTSEGEGGCRENPGIWSLGGTTVSTAEHCTHCGLRRVEVCHGSQRNPGEADTVEYRQPDHWCEEHQNDEEECSECAQDEEVSA